MFVKYPKYHENRQLLVIFLKEQSFESKSKSNHNPNNLQHKNTKKVCKSYVLVAIVKKTLTDM